MSEGLDTKKYSAVSSNEEQNSLPEIRSLGDVQSRIQSRIEQLSQTISSIVTSYEEKEERLSSKERVSEKSRDLTKEEEENARLVEEKLKEYIAGHNPFMQRVLSLFKAKSLNELQQKTNSSSERAQVANQEYIKSSEEIRSEIALDKKELEEETKRILLSQIEGMYEDYQVLYEQVLSILSPEDFQKIREIIHSLNPSESVSDIDIVFNIKVLLSALAYPNQQRLISAASIDVLPAELIAEFPKLHYSKHQFDQQYKQNTVGGVWMYDDPKVAVTKDEMIVTLNYLISNPKISSILGQGKLLEGLNQEIYELLLTQGLLKTEDNSSKGLAMFPTPESLRIALIHSSTNQRYGEESDRFKSSLQIINRFKVNPGWQELLEETMTKYPELEGFRVPLQNLTPESRNLGIENFSEEYINSILELYRTHKDNSGVEECRVLLDAIPAEYFLNDLQRDSRIDSETSIQLREVLARCRIEIEIPHNLNMKTYKMIRDFITNQLYSSFDNPDFVVNSQILSRLGYLTEFIDKRKNDRLNTEELTSKFLSFPENNDFIFDGMKSLDWLSNTDFTNPESKINEQNWTKYLMVYLVSANQQNRFIPHISIEEGKKIEEFFSSNEVPNFCLKQMLSQWREFITSDNNNLPKGVGIFSIGLREGLNLGNFTLIKTVGEVSASVYEMRKREDLTSEQKKNILSIFQIVESGLLNSSKISNETRVSFYNISSKLINSDPVLFESLLPLFSMFRDDPKKLSEFIQEIFPKVNFIKILGKDRAQESVNNIIDLSPGLEELRINFSNEIMKLFRSSLGITKLPENFEEEENRSFNNMQLYLSYLNGRDSEKETIISFYISQMLNKNWQEFRQGSEINVSEYMDSTRLPKITELLKEKKELISQFFKDSGLVESEIAELIVLLQDEVESVTTSKARTIDLIVGDLVESMSTLQDLDLFSEIVDKQRIMLLRKYDPKIVGSCVSNLYRKFAEIDLEGELSNPSGNVFNPEERLIISEIVSILKIAGVEVSKENIKAYFQDGLKLFSNIVSLENFTESLKIPEMVTNLRESLNPDSDVVSIFLRLGEVFTPTSGAFAFSSDIEYLKQLISRHKNKFSKEEEQKVRHYLDNVREKIRALDDVYQKLSERVRKISESPNYKENPQLQRKVEELLRIIETKSVPRQVVSIITNDFNIIVENIRECLSCTTAGENNDTNLTFGDFNKFFVNTSEGGKGLTDQIIYFLPITREDGTPELAFVVDKLYGDQDQSIMLNHLEAVMKKYRQIKIRYPNLKLSVVLPSSIRNHAEAAVALGSKGYSISVEHLKVELVRSVFGMHYPEFGPQGRVTNGEFKVTAHVIKE